MLVTCIGGGLEDVGHIHLLLEMHGQRETDEAGVALLLGLELVLQLVMMHRFRLHILPRAIGDHFVHHKEVRAEASQTLFASLNSRVPRRTDASPPPTNSPPCAFV